MILIINICKEKLHYYEFVKPVEDILKENNIKYFVKCYGGINKKDFDKATKVIICGTSLYDNEFMKHINKFKWILDFNKPVLGICGGMHVLGKLLHGKLKEETEIGFYRENFEKEFLGLLNGQEVYHLHNYYIDFKNLNEFEVYSDNKIPQAIKHKEKAIYGVLFHPEVRQKQLILEFCK